VLEVGDEMPIILPKNESVELTGNAVPSQVFKDRTFYANDPLEKLTGTYEPPVLSGDADPGNVMLGKTFYKDDPTQKLTGTYEPPVLSGDADPGNVMLGKTFYKDDPTQKLTGTYVPEEPPVLDGNAIAGDVLAGKTFYKDDAYTKLTGSLALSGNAVAGNVLAGKTFYKDDAKTKLTGTIPSKAAATITPGTTNQVIAAGQYLSGAQTIAGSANLVPGNIKEGVNIFGKVGTLIEGKQFATGSLESPNQNISVRNLNFKPSIVIVNASILDIDYVFCGFSSVFGSSLYVQHNLNDDSTTSYGTSTIFTYYSDGFSFDSQNTMFINTLYNWLAIKL
jgi:hypothetical protein